MPWRCMRQERYGS